MACRKTKADLLSPPDLAEVGPHDVQNPADLVQLPDSQQCLLISRTPLPDITRFLGMSGSGEPAHRVSSCLGAQLLRSAVCIAVVLQLRLNQQRLLTSTGPIVPQGFQLIDMQGMLSPAHAEALMRDTEARTISVFP